MLHGACVGIAPFIKFRFAHGIRATNQTCSFRENLDRVNICLFCEGNILKFGEITDTFKPSEEIVKEEVIDAWIDFIIVLFVVCEWAPQV